MDGLNAQLRPALVEAGKVPGLVEQLEAMTKSRDDEVAVPVGIQLIPILFSITTSMHIGLHPVYREISTTYNIGPNLKTRR